MKSEMLFFLLALVLDCGIFSFLFHLLISEYALKNVLINWLFILSLYEDIFKSPIFHALFEMSTPRSYYLHVYHLHLIYIFKHNTHTNLLCVTFCLALSDLSLNPCFFIYIFIIYIQFLNPVLACMYIVVYHMYVYMYAAVCMSFFYFSDIIFIIVKYKDEFNFN